MWQSGSAEKTSESARPSQLTQPRFGCTTPRMHSFSLVTGATGFVGSQLVRTLLARGEHVKSAGSRPGSNLAALEGLPAERFKVAVGDVRIEQSVYAVLAGCTRLYHVAANFKMWDPVPARVIAPTVEGMRATLRAAQQRKLEKIVVTSSIAVLGVTAAPEPVDESHAFNLKDPEAYFAAKVAADAVVDEFVAAGQPIVRVLPATIAGPGDWKPTPNGRLLLEYLKTPSTSHFPISAGGINVVDVEDVANGHALAMDRGVVGERYILGGENLTFSQIFETLCDLDGSRRTERAEEQGSDAIRRRAVRAGRALARRRAAHHLAARARLRRRLRLRHEREGRRRSSATRIARRARRWPVRCVGFLRMATCRKRRLVACVWSSGRCEVPGRIFGGAACGGAGRVARCASVRGRPVLASLPRSVRRRCTW